MMCVYCVNRVLLYMPNSIMRRQQYTSIVRTAATASPGEGEASLITCATMLMGILLILSSRFTAAAGIWP